MPATSTLKIAEIVITGGSCAGKTQVIPLLAAALRSRDIRVITVPEVATMIINGALPEIGDIAREDGSDYCRFQREVFTVHRLLRARASIYASSFKAQRAVVLFDRGELDGMSYHNHDCFQDLAAEVGTTVSAIRDSYTAVMHLVTTANGAEDFYNGVNNAARWDNAEEARIFDTKILEVWGDNPRHTIIDNSTDWAGKVERLLDATLAVLGYDDQLRLDVSGSGKRTDAQELTLELQDVTPKPPAGVPALAQAS